MSYDVFISYSSKDKQAADATCAVLERNGLRCWIAPRDIVPGQEWSKAIVDALGGARAFVLIFSGNANASAQVKREVELAVDRGVPIVPVRIEDVQPSESLEYFISTQHWMDAITPPLEHHLEQLARSIGVLIRGAAPDGARPMAYARPVDPAPSKPAAPRSRDKVLLAIGATVLSISAIVIAVLLLRAPTPGEVPPIGPKPTPATSTSPVSPEQDATASPFTRGRPVEHGTIEDRDDEGRASASECNAAFANVVSIQVQGQAREDAELMGALIEEAVKEQFMQQCADTPRRRVACLRRAKDALDLEMCGPLAPPSGALP